MSKSPNVESLGRTLSSELNESARHYQSMPEKSYNPLLTLQTGRSQRQIPFFCIPGAGDSATVFMELVERFDMLQPVFGFQPRGLDGMLIPHSTVLAASALYLSSLETAYPKGALNLLGHSFGGWVALEMAEQLARRGRQVNCLFVLDSDAPELHCSPPRDLSRADVLMKLIEIFELSIGHSLGISRTDLDSRTAASQLELLHNALAKAGHIPERSDPTMLRGPIATLGMALRTSYQPTARYMGFTRLIVVDDPRRDESSNHLRHKSNVEAWRYWTPNLDHHHASGNHLTMLKRPHVRELVNLMSLRR